MSRALLRIDNFSNLSLSLHSLEWSKQEPASKELSQRRSKSEKVALKVTAILRIAS